MLPEEMPELPFTATPDCWEYCFNAFNSGCALMENLRTVSWATLGCAITTETSEALANKPKACATECFMIPLLVYFGAVRLTAPCRQRPINELAHPTVTPST
jgi:hypothetical protein